MNAMGLLPNFTSNIERIEGHRLISFPPEIISGRQKLIKWLKFP